MINSSFPWLTGLILLPLIGAGVVLALPGGFRRWARHVAVAFSLLTLGIAVLTLLAFDTGDAGTVQLTEQVSWIPAFGVSYALGVNGVGLLLVLLSVLLVPLVLLAAWREHPDAAVDDVVPHDAVPHDPVPHDALSEDAPSHSALPDDAAPGTFAGRRIRDYVALVLVLEAMMIAVFAARDVFLFYVLFEAMLIPVYFMIGAFGGAQRRYAAVKFLIYSLAGGLVMLAGVIALRVQGPGGPDAFLIDTLAGTEMATWVERAIFLSFFFAFAIKAPMWPVHTWLPDAAEQAPAGTNVLLVGVLDKVGTFGMLTLCLPLFPEASKWAAPVIIVLAVISILYGAFLAIGQENLMRLIAYTSVSHFGFIVLGIFAFTSVSIEGASLYMLTHGLSTGGLFLLAGFLVARWGTARIGGYGGLQRSVPILAGTFLVMGLSALSLPGLAPFVAELLVFVGTFSAHPVAAIVATLGVVLAALYILLTYQRVFTGPLNPSLAVRPDLSARERWVIGPLVAAIVVLGLYPAPALDLVREPAGQTVAELGIDDLSTTIEGEPDEPSDEGSDQ